MKTNRNVITATTLLFATVIWAPLAHALIEVQLECEQFTVDAKPETARPTTGSVAIKPSQIHMDEAAGATVVVKVVEALKGKSIVVEDKSGGVDGKSASVLFGSGTASDATVAGKVYIHFDWVTLSQQAGNIFATLKNAKNQPILALMYNHTAADITVIVGDKTSGLPGVVELDKPADMDITLDLDQWRYEISINGKKAVDGPMAKTEDNSFLNIGFYTTAPSIASFAVKNVTISPIPIKR